MPGAGTDKTKDWVERPGPCVILVEPQLADNIGASARAMANFALSRLRLIKPRDGWPNRRAYVAASGAASMWIVASACAFMPLPRRPSSAPASLRSPR